MVNGIGQTSTKALTLGELKEALDKAFGEIRHCRVEGTSAYSTSQAVALAGRLEVGL